MNFASLPHYIFLQRSERPPLAGRNPLGLAYCCCWDKREGCVQAPLALLSLIPGSQWMNTSPGASHPLKQAGTISCWKVKQGGCVWASRATRMYVPVASAVDLSCHQRLQESVPGLLRSTIWNSQAAVDICQMDRLLCQSLPSTVGSCHLLKCFLQPHTQRSTLP